MAASNTADSPIETAAGRAGRAAIEAFSTLGNEARLAILLALWEAYEPFGEENTVSFSELRERVGMADSGQFNYHLDKLVGHFVESRSDGYVLRKIGHRIVQAVIAGTGLHEHTQPPAEVDLPCYRCGTQPTEVSYRDETTYLICPECEGRTVSTPRPRGTLLEFEFNTAGLGNRTPLEVFIASHMEAWGNAQKMRAGVCWACSGVVEKSLRYCSNHSSSPDERCAECGYSDAVGVRYVCTVCKNANEAVIMAEIDDHPAVISFYYDHGIDRGIDTRDPERYHLSWNLLWEIEHSVVSTEPLRIDVTFPCEGKELRLTLDSELNVIETDRSTH